MRVAVTGSTGLIGRTLVERLEAGGHQAVRIVRPRGSSGSDPSTAVVWDPTAPEFDAGGLEGLDAVVHLAGEPIAARRWSPDQKTRIAESRVRGTAVLAQALARLSEPPGVLVSASAIGYYGSRGDELLDESSSRGSDFLADVCRDWETAADPARGRGDPGGASPHRGSAERVGRSAGRDVAFLPARPSAGASATAASG